MLSEGTERKEKSEVNRSRTGSSILPAIICGALLIINGCAGLRPRSSDSANSNQPLVTESAGFITSVNGERFKNGRERYEGGYRVEIEGTFPEPSMNGIIVVKSDRKEYYVVQPRLIRTTRTSWIGQAFLGEPELGIGESFTVFAIFTPDTSDTFEEGQKLEREPEGLKSAIINYTRTRN